MNNTKPPVIFIMGPTASGKTQLAMTLYDKLPAELVSVDSALIYRSMDIGTAKPTLAEQAQYPHALLDIRDPAESYSAAEFYQDAQCEIKKIHARGNIPILVGGTMLYFKALLEGLSPLPTADSQIRASIEAEAIEKGWPYIHAKLSAIDPVSGARIHENDSQRICRALEVYLITGKSMTVMQQAKGMQFDYPVIQLALLPKEREWLHKRIELRFELMVKDGFISEVEHLIARGDLNLDMPSMRSVGYRQAWEYLHGAYDKNEFIFRGVCATRQLAKRQLTWLRSWNDAHALNCQNQDQMYQSVIEILKKQAII
ncbi:tRNA (adenosine(37)-N6)-dimethylallyltransferase MiaA [Thorsellia anophelis]|uniref:tRNA dimethylallyltransferase n=1 Tax=Thorsellia anophelis DSM 18579 TaxID=1123402 RepID=A0A1I0BCM5_9GAMM|nr:tRNA (adenosine(37)-N6)-dimethylallyltransferase MiaA [Thorsellia anophelis]SET04258.1 tRNA dimethylallyltransferase [Thorsellia anophelis DSM 18579]